MVTHEKVFKTALKLLLMMEKICTWSLHDFTTSLCCLGSTLNGSETALFNPPIAEYLYQTNGYFYLQDLNLKYFIICFIFYFHYALAVIILIQHVGCSERIRKMNCFSFIKLFQSLLLNHIIIFWKQAVMTSGWVNTYPPSVEATKLKASSLSSGGGDRAL